MAKIATKKIGSIGKLRDNLAKGGGAWLITSVPSENSLVVRFLTEPDEWVGYEEVWDAGMKKFYPATEGMVLTEDQNATFRYLACAVDVANSKVIALKLPKALANRLVNRYDKYQTLLDRDYELERYGSGFDTTYEVTPEAPSKRKLDRYELLVLEDVLMKAYEEVFGSDDDDDDDDDEPVAKTPSRTGASRRKSKPEPEEEEDDDDEEYDDEDEEDDEEEADIEEEEVEEYYEDELEEMTITELRVVAREFDVATAKVKKSDLIEQILDAQDELLEA